MKADSATSRLASALLLLFAGSCSLPLSGCAPILLATAGAVAGYAVGKDKVTLDLDRPWDPVWSACAEEVKYLGGRIKKEDRSNGRLDVQVKKADVVITLEQLTPSTVRVVIRARKNLLPQLEIAQRLGVGILRRVH
ncbi:MAG: DUF3568 family protein [Candidatus Omnitrophica bacterium]|nr:DUF3568 family protein [Candidatus Omnitrophota bacterium]